MLSAVYCLICVGIHTQLVWSVSTPHLGLNYTIPSEISRPRAKVVVFIRPETRKKLSKKKCSPHVYNGHVFRNNKKPRNEIMKRYLEKSSIFLVHYVGLLFIYIHI
jgi:hypothetical protein